MSVLSSIGLYSVLILGVFSLFLLKSKPKYMVIFFVGFVVNFIGNIILKYIFFQPLPNINKETFYTELKYKYNDNIFSIHPKFLDIPSGHLQNLSYIIVFMSNFIQSRLEYFIYFSIPLISIYFVYINHYHTLISGTTGVIIGSFTGYLVYQFAKKRIN